MGQPLCLLRLAVRTVRDRVMISDLVGTRESLRGGGRSKRRQTGTPLANGAMGRRVDLN